MTTQFPTGYGYSLVSLDHLHDHHVQHGMDPRFADRLFPWLENGDGQVGIGAAWRRTPSSCSAASRAGHSFHQTQHFADGFRGFVAVDLVARNPGHKHRAPHVNEVPVQGSHDAQVWGVHVNVGTPHTRGFEVWHMQPIEIDGYQSWHHAGSQRISANYPLPHGATHVRPAPVHMAQHHDTGIPRHSMRMGSTGHEVQALQVGLRSFHHSMPHQVADPGNPDGKFGSRTERALKGWQDSVGHIAADGQYGPQTEAKWREVADFLDSLDQAE